MLPASPVSRGCRILLSRTCWRRSESRVLLSPPKFRMRDFRRFSWGEEGGISLRDDEECLRFVPMPRRRKILRLRPPSVRRGMRVASVIRACKTVIREGMDNRGSECAIYDKGGC
jgi:hypothetical protein